MGEPAGDLSRTIYLFFHLLWFSRNTGAFSVRRDYVCWKFILCHYRSEVLSQSTIYWGEGWITQQARRWNGTRVEWHRFQCFLLCKLKFYADPFWAMEVEHSILRASWIWDNFFCCLLIRRLKLRCCMYNLFLKNMAFHIFWKFHSF